MRRRKKLRLFEPVPAQKAQSCRVVLSDFSRIHLSDFIPMKILIVLPRGLMATKNLCTV